MTDWLIDWVETGVTSTGTVTLYGDANAVKKYAELEAKIKEIEEGEDGVDGRTLTSGSVPNRLREELQRIADEELVPSGVVWTLRALEDEEIKAISSELEFPAPPIEPSAPRRSGNPAAWQNYEDAMERYRKDSVDFVEATAELNEARHLLYIQTAFVQAETPTEVRDSVTIEGLEALRHRPHGQLQIQMLIDKITELTQQPMDVDVPKSLTPSETIQG